MSIDFTQSFSIRPDTLRVKPIRSLGDFINQYPDEELVPNLILLNQKYQYYRPICGDGNCFYRACMFLYFSSVDLTNYNKLFPSAPIKNCINLPFQFDDFNVEQILSYIWKQFLLPLSKLDRFQRQKELSVKLNNSILLDAFLIAYFRSLNHQYLTKNIQKFMNFAEDDADKDFTQVLTYSRQSEGIQLFAMAQFLNIKITIMMVHRLNFQEIVYMEGAKNNFALFYRPGHYDILCTEQEFTSQASKLGKMNNSSLIKQPIIKKWKEDPTIPAKKQQANVVKINNLTDLSKYGPLSNGKHKKTMNNINQFYRPNKASDTKIRASQPPQIKISTKNGQSFKKSSKSSKPNLLKPKQDEPKSDEQKKIPNIDKTKITIQAVILATILILCLATIPFI